MTFISETFFQQDKEAEREIRKIIQKKELKKFFKKTQLLVIKDVAFDYLIIFFSIFSSLIYENYFIYFLSILLIASRMRALENLLHEGSHFNLFNSKKFNDFFCFIFLALPLFSSMNTYRESHLRHHKFLGNSQKDPDLIRYHQIGIDNLPFSKTRMFFHFLKVFSMLHVLGFLKSSISLFIYSKGVNTKKEILFRCAFYCFLFLSLHHFKALNIFFLYWIVPYLTIFQIIKYLGEISEHGGLYYKSKDSVLLTRNSLCSPFFRFFIYPHNDNYHLIHHIFPSINYRYMPKIHKILMKESNIYRNAHHCYGYFHSNQGISTIEEITN